MQVGFRKQRANKSRVVYIIVSTDRGASVHVVDRGRSSWYPTEEFPQRVRRGLIETFDDRVYLRREIWIEN